MTHDPDRFPERLRAYNEPPAMRGTDYDAMWDAIESEAFRARFMSPSATRTSHASRWWSARSAVPIAAALVLGVAIGRMTARKPATPSTVAVNRASADSVALPEPYQSTTSRYLGQTAALLVALPAEIEAGRADAQFIGRAHDLLLTTRLLLDSPAASDPRLRTLFDDLELVLAQVVRLQSEQRPAELDLIRQALEQRDVLPRLRNAAADISADN